AERAHLRRRAIRVLRFGHVIRRLGDVARNLLPKHTRSCYGGYACDASHRVTLAESGGERGERGEQEESVPFHGSLGWGSVALSARTERFARAFATSSFTSLISVGP